MCAKQSKIDRQQLPIHHGVAKKMVGDEFVNACTSRVLTTSNDGQLDPTSISGMGNAPIEQLAGINDADNQMLLNSLSSFDEPKIQSSNPTNLPQLRKLRQKCQDNQTSTKSNVNRFGLDGIIILLISKTGVDRPQGGQGAAIKDSGTGEDTKRESQVVSQPGDKQTGGQVPNRNQYGASAPSSSILVLV